MKICKIAAKKYYNKLESLKRYFDNNLFLFNSN